MIRFSEVLGVVDEDTLLESVMNTISEPDKHGKSEGTRTAFCMKDFAFGTIRVDMKLMSGGRAEVTDAYFVAFNYQYKMEKK